MKAYIVIVIAAFLSASSTAGLFDAVKNVAGGVAGMGRSCQASLPSGASCGNATVGGSPYCQRHKCQLCNGLVWADGVCRNCQGKKEANDKVAGKAKGLRRQKDAERALLSSSATSERSGATSSKRGRSRKGSASIEQESDQNDSSTFGGYVFGTIANSACPSIEESMDKKFLKIFTSAKLFYGPKSWVLTEIDFESIPLHVSSKDELESFARNVCDNLKVCYGFEMRRFGGGDYGYKGGKYWVRLGSVDHKTTGPDDEFKTLRLQIISVADKELERKFDEAKVAADLSIAPYGKNGYLYRPSGLVFELVDEHKDGRACKISAFEDSIVKRNRNVIKIPSVMTFGPRMKNRGTFRVLNLAGAMTAANESWKDKRGKIVFDLTEIRESDELVKLQTNCWSSIEGILFSEEVAAARNAIAKARRDEEESVRQKALAAEKRIDDLYQAAIMAGKNKSVEEKEKEWKSRHVKAGDRPNSFFGIPFDVPIEVDSTGPLALPLSNVKVIEPTKYTDEFGAYRFYPVKKWRSFENYELRISPISHKVVSITFKIVESKKRGVEIPKGEFEEIKRILEAKFSQNTKDPGEVQKNVIWAAAMGGAEVSGIGAAVALSNEGEIKFRDGSYVLVRQEMADPLGVDKEGEELAQELSVVFVDARQKGLDEGERSQNERNKTRAKNKDDVDIL